MVRAANSSRIAHSSNVQTPWPKAWSPDCQTETNEGLVPLNRNGWQYTQMQSLPLETEPFRRLGCSDPAKSVMATFEPNKTLKGSSALHIEMLHVALFSLLVASTSLTVPDPDLKFVAVPHGSLVLKDPACTAVVRATPFGDYTCLHGPERQGVAMFYMHVNVQREAASSLVRDICSVSRLVVCHSK
eukprot:4687707-Amphidinium_carterae.1